MGGGEGDSLRVRARPPRGVLRRFRETRMRDGSGWGGGRGGGKTQRVEIGRKGVVIHCPRSATNGCLSRCAQRGRR